MRIGELIKEDVIDFEPRRYIVGPWGHIFGLREVEVRLAYDTDKEAIVAMEVMGNGWRPADEDEIRDVEESLKSANSEALDNPQDYGLKFAAVLPDWARRSPRGG